MTQTAARFGAHMPAVGGLQNAIFGGQAVGCEVVQVFTKSPQQWKARTIPDEEVAAFLQAQRDTGIACVAAHDSYLINPASEDPEILAKSREALLDEMRRSARLQIPFVVMHLGAQGSATEEEALGRLRDTVSWVLDASPWPGPVLLLETTAGQGKCLGHRFEHLKSVIDHVDDPERLGVCLDTCHVFAAGYDLRTPETYAAALDEFEATVGGQHLRLIHANDSKKELGSRVDRHEHIGRGCLGTEAFRLLLSDPRYRHVPVILETPKVDKDGDGGSMDPVNLQALRHAAGCSVPQT